MAGEVGGVAGRASVKVDIVERVRSMAAWRWCIVVA